MANDDEDAITDQQRCEEWAEMDGIDNEKKPEYLAECLSNLQYDDESDETDASTEEWGTRLCAAFSLLAWDHSSLLLR